MYQAIFHGNNLIPEGLEIGEPKIQSTFSNYDFEPCYVVAYSGTNISDSQTVDQSGEVINGIFSSVAYLLCNSGGFSDLMEYLNQAHTDSQGQIIDYSQYIVACFTVPILAFKSIYVPDIPTILKIDASVFEQAIEYTIASKPSNLNGYTPRNKKLLTYPFTYLAFNPSNRNIKNL